MPGASSFESLFFSHGLYLQDKQVQNATALDHWFNSSRIHVLRCFLFLVLRDWGVIWIRLALPQINVLEHWFATRDHAQECNHWQRWCPQRSNPRSSTFRVPLSLHLAYQYECHEEVQTYLLPTARQRARRRGDRRQSIQGRCGWALEGLFAVLECCDRHNDWGCFRHRMDSSTRGISRA